MATHDRRPVVAVVGDGSQAYPEKSVWVGEWIAQSGCHLLTGGGGGVMETVTEAFCDSFGRNGVAVGIIPGHIETRPDRPERLFYRTKGSAYPNASVEIAIFTHLPGEDPEGERSRNHINVLSADLVIALPGSRGTHAEIQLARKYGTPLLVFLNAGETIHGKSAADLSAQGFHIVDDFAALVSEANRMVHPEAALRKPVSIALSKCTVRSWRWNDAESLPKHANNRNVARNLLDGFPSPYTLRDARRWLAHATSMIPETSFAIEIEGEAAGGIGFIPKQGPARHSAEVGYWIGEAHWGRGIAPAALSALTPYIFENFTDIWRLYANTFEWNRASMRVLEKAGFRREGTMRQSAMKDGRIIDMELYSLVVGAKRFPSSG